MKLNPNRIISYTIFGNEEDVTLTITQPDNDTKTSFHNSLNDAVEYLRKWNDE